MSEPDEVQADEASANGQEPGGEKSQEHSWLVGDPDPERLVSYATNLRTERAELKERLQKAEGTWDDEDEWLKRGEERFPHRFVQDSEETEDDDDEFEDDDDDPRDHKLSEHEERLSRQEAWIKQQQQDASERQFSDDVGKLAAAAEVDLDDDDLELIRRKGEALGGDKGWGRDELGKAFQWLIDRDARVAQRKLDQVKSSKRAPHTPTGGTAGKGSQPDMSTEEGRKQFYEQRLGSS